MINKAKIYTILFIPFWVFFHNEVDFTTKDLIKIDHTVVLKHPGEEDEIEIILTEVQNKDSLPVSYYMEVESVICFKEVCKVIPVRIYWNNLGEYIRYELEEGATLEKYETDLFEEKDYKKLHHVLSSQDSPFKEVGVDEVLTVVDENDIEGVDAVSGATALELDEEDTVPGAALTCFTLWHWANGEVIKSIRQITAASSNLKQIEDFLHTDAYKYKLFAIEALLTRGYFDAVMMNLVSEQIAQHPKLLLKNGIEYIENAPSDMFYKTMRGLYLRDAIELRNRALSAILYTKHQAPNEKYFIELSTHILGVRSYQELDIMLRLFEMNSCMSPEIIENMLPILKYDFLMARRAYWFLKKCRLNPDQEQMLLNFYNIHKAQL